MSDPVFSGDFKTGDLGRLAPLPVPFDEARLGRFREDASGLYQKLAGLGPAAPGIAGLLDGIGGNSPYLARLILRDPDYVLEIIQDGPGAMLERLLGEVRGPVVQSGSKAMLMARLRGAKMRMALVVALADLGGLWSVESTTRALSDFADAATATAVDWLLLERHAQGTLVLPDPDRPGRGAGLAVLAMGKHGARELNYSSDIDLVVFYDGDVMPAGGSDRAQTVSIGLTRALVEILQQPTGDGYVFRVDLRLRPDAGSTPVAVSFRAAEQYYEGLGQNWERAAFIKARCVAGDGAACGRFLSMLSPFIWRKYLDYATIEDIHAIKRQINAHNGFDAVDIEGHNVKLGRGGIREVEFFAQTQQLIAGGKIPALRVRGTVEALEALAQRGLVETPVANDLVGSYRFFRTLEHRLQMIADEQTHVLPRTGEGVAHVAHFMGLPAPGQFQALLRSHLDRVSRHYAGLFDADPPLTKASGNLVFTGVENDPETLDTLRQLGFVRPSVVCDSIRGWNFGRIRATRTARARAALTRLMPSLLDALSETSDPDAAFLRFDAFLAGQPAGVQLFALLQANPDLLTLLTDLLGRAPRFAGTLSRNPGLLDAMLDPQFFATLPGPARLERLTAENIAQARDFEDILDRTRRFAREQAFRIGVQLVRGTLRAGRAGVAQAALAQAVVRALKPVVEAEMAERHGRVPGGSLAVIALGKLGSWEMTAASDLDLIFLYDHDGAFAASEGPAGLHASHYFTRLSQRLINALTAPTADGRFYEVDMRLRPSGRAGPIATRLDAFAAYHKNEAWTWERMALTRARVLAGEDPLAQRVTDTIRAALLQPDDPKRVFQDARDMRLRLAQEHRTDDPWEVKTVRGGLIDIEFIAQALQLVHGPNDPALLHPTTTEALARLGRAGHLDERAVHLLVAGARIQQAIAQILTLSVEGRFDPAQAPQALLAGLARAAGCSSFALLESELLRIQQAVYALFEKLIDDGTMTDTDRI